MPAKRGRPPKQPIAQKIISALDVAQEEVNKIIPVVQQNALVPIVGSPEIITVEAPKVTKEARDDYDFARTNLYSLLSKGNQLLDGITSLAEDSDHPRTYEVAGLLVKVLLEGTRELMTLQKDIRSVEKQAKSDDMPMHIEHANDVTQNNFIEGTTMEMLEVLAEMKRKKIEAQEKKEQGS